VCAVGGEGGGEQHGMGNTTTYVERCHEREGSNYGRNVAILTVKTVGKRGGSGDPEFKSIHNTKVRKKKRRMTVQRARLVRCAALH